MDEPDIEVPDDPAPGSVSNKSRDKDPEPLKLQRHADFLNDGRLAEGYVGGNKTTVTLYHVVTEDNKFWEFIIEMERFVARNGDTEHTIEQHGERRTMYDEEAHEVFNKTVEKYGLTEITDSVDNLTR